MKKLVYFIGCIIILSVSSCQKDKINIIEGYFYEDCNKTPTANLELKINSVTQQSFGRVDIVEYLGAIKTDANGYFKFEFEGDPNYFGYDFYRNNNDLYFEIGYDKKTTFCAFKNVKCTHHVIIKTDKPFTNQDTLYFGAALNATEIILAGPFTNGQTIPIIIRPNFGSTGAGLFPSDRTGEGHFWWGIGAEEYNKVTYNPNFHIPPNVIRGTFQNVCGQGGDVVVDLRGK